MIGGARRSMLRLEGQRMRWPIKWTAGDHDRLPQCGTCAALGPAL